MLKKIAAYYCIFIGVSMTAIWLIFYFTGSIPEIEAEPVEFGLHILAELITAILLIISGIGLFKSKKWAYEIYLFSLGMLSYTLIMSPGYFAQKGDFNFVLMFMVFIIATLALLSSSLREKNKFKS